jgi:hypothetical protein
VTDKTVGLRVSPDEEATGLDLSEHGEVAYEWDASSVGEQPMSAPLGALTATPPDR